MNRDNQEKLAQAIDAYLLWMIDQDYSRSTWSFYNRVLVRFQHFNNSVDLSWEQIFSKATLAVSDPAKMKNIGLLKMQ